MGKKIVIISSSIREKSNSEILAREAERGAKGNGNAVEFISLKNKTINFCKGCLACQNTLKCVIKDDAAEIANSIKESDILVFVTPIYYYEMSGQLKTLLDRCNPLYPADYKFRGIYMLTTAAEDTDEVSETAKRGLIGWIDCFEKAEFKGLLSCVGLNEPNEATTSEKYLKLAYEFGKNLK